MGAFIIMDISFERKKDRKKFEEKNKIKKKNILVSEKSNSHGFSAWTYTRNPCLDIVYNMGFMGYEEPKELLKACLKEGIKINFFSWIPINDRNTKWEQLKWSK